jgi:ATP-dependent Lhr-like helicase
MRSDPYRIVFEFPTLARPELAKKILEDLEPGAVEEILKKNLSRSSLFKYEFIHVAKRFGLLEKGADYRRIGLRRLIGAVIDSPIAREVLNTLLTEKLNSEKAKWVVSQVKNKKIKVKIAKNKKPSELASFARHASDLVLPERAMADITELVKERILSKNAHLACTYCLHSWYTEIRDLPEDIKCPNCRSSMVAFLQKRGAKGLLDKNKNKLSANEQKERATVERVASLVSTHGRRAVIALAARGVGPEIASRLLGRLHENEEKLFKDLVEAERTFTRTHRYWA